MSDDHATRTETTEATTRESATEAAGPTVPAEPTDQLRRPLAALFCQSCQRMTEVQFHCTDHDVDAVDQCRMSQGAGTWLCAACHHGVHEYMAANPEPGRAATSLLHMTERVARIVTSTPRPYRRASKSAAEQ